MIKGLILAGGSGTRLYPMTKVITKQLLPVYDKPMIFYPLSVLMLAKIQEVAIIVTKKDLQHFKDLLGFGENLGMQIQYIVQDKPDGLAHAFIIGRDFIGNNSSMLILGDNIFYGHGFSSILEKHSKIDKDNGGAVVFAYPVKDPERFGVATLDSNKNILSIEEKPANPKSNYALTGLYFYDKNVCEIASHLKPSPRGELEITDINKAYLKDKKLKVEILGRGFAWLDTGTADSMIDASKFVSTIENNQGYKIACLEEIAFYNGWISKDQIYNCAKMISKSSYGQYLLNLIKDI